jgi:glycosyltransferase involved in cell wall biosynthesis
MNANPLVSILIPSYNYARYLDRCLTGALDQTYANLEVVLVDNHSSDDSYDVALAYERRFRERLRVYRNDENIGGSANHLKALRLANPRAECILYLSADDAIDPTFVARGVAVMRAHPTVGVVIVHRSLINERDEIIAEPPFYNRSCVIPGAEQMAVFMMAGIGVPSQCLRKRYIDYVASNHRYIFDVAGDWFANFCMAAVADVGYLMEPLCLYRVHSTNVTSGAIRDLTNSFEHVMMLHAFAQIARSVRRPAAAARLPAAIGKLGAMCLRYCAQMLREGDAYTARRYLHLAVALDTGLRADPLWRALGQCVDLSPAERLARLADLEAQAPLRRTVSYDPPAGAIAL